MVTSYALRPAWTPLTILLMVIGFIVFWPLGLAMLAYILWGDRIPEVQRHFADAKRDWSHDFRCGPRGRRGSASYSRSGNVAFDDYRAKELKRLEEERRKLDEELRAFEAFMNDLRRARDQEEFDRFTRQRAERPRNGDRDNGDTVDL